MEDKYFHPTKSAPSYTPSPQCEACSYTIEEAGQLKFLNEDPTHGEKPPESECDDNPFTRIYCARVPSPRDGRVQIPEDILKNSFFARYRNQSLQLSGQVACTDYSREFTLQTPLDDHGPFLQLHAERGLRTGITLTYLYSDDCFRPSALFSDVKWLYRWRWNSYPLLIPAICWVKAHEAVLAKLLDKLHLDISMIEDHLSRPPSADGGPLPLDQLSRELHLFSVAHHGLLRRSHFQELVLKTIGENLRASKSRMDEEIEELHLSPYAVAVENRKFDLDLFSKRVETARQSIFQLAIQRDQTTSLAMAQTQLEIAESSHNIATLTMQDSAAMRTIAVLTMIFLPGTAIASIFSMTMFNWTSRTTDGVVSSYIWVYFAIAVPLTLLVLGIWWLWFKRSHNH